MNYTVKDKTYQMFDKWFWYSFIVFMGAGYVLAIEPFHPTRLIMFLVLAIIWEWFTQIIPRIFTDAFMDQSRPTFVFKYVTIVVTVCLITTLTICRVYSADNFSILVAVLGTIGCSMGLTFIVFYSFSYVYKMIQRNQKNLSQANKDLYLATQQLNELKGLLPICSFCKKVRDDGGYWDKIESYLCKHSDMIISNSRCPKCEGE